MAGRFRTTLERPEHEHPVAIGRRVIGLEREDLLGLVVSPKEAADAVTRRGPIAYLTDDGSAG